MKSKILILGAAGQVGSEVKAQLLNRFEGNFDGDIEIFFTSRSELDLSNFVQLHLYLSKIKPDCIINTAAYTAVDSAEVSEESAYLMNDHFPRELAIFCARENSVLLHLSTDYVFDGQKQGSYTEEDETSPINIYGSSKLRGERAIREKLRRHIILRTSWVFGAQGKNFVKAMLSKLDESRVYVVEDQRGAPTAAQSIAAVLVTIAGEMLHADESDSRWGTYHFTGDKVVSWADFAEEIFLQTSHLLPDINTPRVSRVPSASYPTAARRPVNSNLACNKIREVFDVSQDEWTTSLKNLLHFLLVEEKK